MIKCKEVVSCIYSLYGKNVLALYLQGGHGRYCISCGCHTPPHSNDCEFVKEAKLLLEESDSDV